MSELVLNFSKIFLLSPVFFVFLLSLMVWFFLELSLHCAHFFNTKHAINKVSGLHFCYNLLRSSNKFTKVLYIKFI